MPSGPRPKATDALQSVFSAAGVHVIRAEGSREVPRLQANGYGLCWVGCIEPDQAGRAVTQRKLSAVPAGAAAVDLPDAEAVLAGGRPAAEPGRQEAALGSDPDRHMCACSRDRSQAEGSRAGADGSPASCLAQLARKRGKTQVLLCSAQIQDLNTPGLAVTTLHRYFFCGWNPRLRKRINKAWP